MTQNKNTPPVRDSGATGVPEADKRSLVDDEDISSEPVPKTGGAPAKGKEPLPDAAANRNREGVRESGATPRPTDKPIVGGDRGSVS